MVFYFAVWIAVGRPYLIGLVVVVNLVNMFEKVEGVLGMQGALKVGTRGIYLFVPKSRVRKYSVQSLLKTKL